MTVRYKTNDNKYMQYKYKDTSIDSEDFINVDNWEGIELDNAYSDFAVSDDNGYDILQVKNGYVKSKNFDSSFDTTLEKRGLMSAQDKLTINAAVTKLATIEKGANNSHTDILNADVDFEISDENGYNIVQFKNGHVRTKNFDSENSEIHIEDDGTPFSISDDLGNSIFQIKNGHIKTKNFDSSKILDDNVNICIDDTVYAVVGDKLQIYYNSILRCNDYRNYDINAVCDIGRHFPRYFEVTPVDGNVGTHELVISVKNNNNHVISTKKVNLVVKSPVSPSVSTNVFCIGASTMQGGQWVSELQRRLTMSGGNPMGDNLLNISFVGRMAVTYNDITTHLEATGGNNFYDYVNKTAKRCRFNVSDGLSVNISVGDEYSWNGHVFTVYEKNMSNNYFTCDVDDLTLEIYSTNGTLTKIQGDGDNSVPFLLARSVGNPFVYDGELNYSQYIEDYCNSRVDVVLADLLGNGSKAYCETADDFSHLFVPMLSFINNMLDAQPNVKIGIITSPLPSQNGGLGHDYNANNDYDLGNGLKYTYQNKCAAVKEFIEKNNLGNNVFAIDFASVCDSENNFPTEDVPVNTRSEITEKRGTNGVHPILSGYMQMADAAYRMFINRFC